MGLTHWTPWGRTARIRLGWGWDGMGWDGMGCSRVKETVEIMGGDDDGATV
jgi:hypothetical protein